MVTRQGSFDALSRSRSNAFPETIYLAAMTFLRPFLALSALGLLGILSLLPTLGPAIETIRKAPGAPAVSDTALALLALVQPTVLLLVAVAIGVALGHRVGLRSILVSRLRGEAPPDLRAGLPVALGLAVLVGTAIVVLDIAFKAATDPGALRAAGGAPGLEPAARMAALLYGGITEELLLRFGLLTLLLWMGRRLLPRAAPHAVASGGIGLTALLFGVGHLPKLFAITTPSTALVIHIVILNALAGLAYGWLAWRHSLEHAMISHMATHVTFWLVTPVLLRGALALT